MGCPDETKASLSPPHNGAGGGDGGGPRIILGAWWKTAFPFVCMFQHKCNKHPHEPINNRQGSLSSSWGDNFREPEKITVVGEEEAELDANTPNSNPGGYYMNDDM